MQKKDLVSMFMESPFYFELTPREILFLLNDHRSLFGAAESPDTMITADRQPRPWLEIAGAVRSSPSSRPPPPPGQNRAERLSIPR